MSTIFLGIDVIKGYGDFAFINESGGILRHCRFDDTEQGHSSLFEVLAELSDEKFVQRFIVGIESSGGLERNWIGFFRKYASTFKIQLNRLNPFAVKRFLDGDLHRGVTDKSSSIGIAQYLRKGLFHAGDFDDEMDGLRTLYRVVRRQIAQSSELRNELQSLLPVVHPELVRYCRFGIRKWTLELLCRYPTVSFLSRIDPSELAGIVFLRAGRAESVVDSARASVASQLDDNTGDTVVFLAGEILRRDKQIKMYKKKICSNLSNDETFRILNSIPGIGIWSAACLRLEIGRIERFHSPEALVAYAGLDPRTRQSGDSMVNCGISRRGRKQIRQILYPVILASLHYNPVISSFYSRLRGSGKKHLVAAVACMNKILHIAYGCMISRQMFDKERYFEVYQRYNEEKMKRRSERRAMVSNLSITAPVSKREAGKRRAAAMPQCGKTAQVRGQAAATVLYNNRGRE